MFKQPFFFIMLVLVSFSAVAEEPPRYQEGVHYRTLAMPLKSTYRGEEIGEIVEFFSYSCIHCYNFEPVVEQFLQTKSDKIRFTALPVMFNERQAPEVRAYYVLQLKQLGKQAHQRIFDAIHAERKSLRTDKAFARFFADNFDISEEDYMAAAYSFSVEPLVKKSVLYTGQSGIGGTPTIMANGKYVIDSSAVGGHEQALLVATWLIEQDAS